MSERDASTEPDAPAEQPPADAPAEQPAEQPATEQPASDQPQTPAPAAESERPAGESERPAGDGERERAPSREASASRSDDDERPRGRGGGRRFGRRKVCTFCVEKATSIDYKDPGKLRRYLSDRGRIDARRKTGTCAKHQRWLAVALKRARHLALMPYSPEHIRVTGMFASRR